jgi:N-acetylneuraminic acid mutarotase
MIFFWFCCYCAVLLINCSHFSDGSQDKQIEPLLWDFQSLPNSACTKQATCKQAALNDGKVLMFDGFTKRTWVFMFNKIEKHGKWIPITTTNSPSRRESHAIVSLGNGRVAAFGGLTGTISHNDTWFFDQSTKHWTPFATINSPPARYDHAMARLGNGRVLLFGGLNATKQPTEVFSDTWLLDQSTKEWILIVTKNFPKARGGHSMASIGSDVLLFGGYSEIYTDFNDTWRFDQSTNEWTHIESTLISGSPNARFYHSMVGQDGYIVLFGGASHKPLKYFADTWIFNHTKNEWRKLLADKPHSRLSPVMSPIGEGKVLMFGGMNGHHIYTDTWIFDMYSYDNSYWTACGCLAPITNSPEERYSHAWASLEEDKILLFGGGNHNDAALNGTWIFDQRMREWLYCYDNGICNISIHLNKATSNILNVPAHVPKTRIYHTMASLGNGSVLLYGGRNSIKPFIYFHDTWVFTSYQSTRKWELVENSNSPKARIQHAMSSLEKGVVLMFGGVTLYDQFLEDTWLFYESTREWMLVDNKVTAKSPSGRIFHAMSSLIGEGKTLLFGGIDKLLNFLDDTWIFDQRKKEWIKIICNILPTDSPPGRALHSMASLGQSKVVMFGGEVDTDVYAQDTWMFHHESSTTWRWTKLKTQMAPRTAHKMSYGLSNSIVLFGGIANYQSGVSSPPMVADDTWILYDGCPIGYGGDGCIHCPVGKYKNTTESTGCISCPVGTTTGSTGSTAESQCLLCANTTADKNFGVCTVDLSNNYKTEWRCFNAFGTRCLHKCPGGTTNPCNGNGKCESGSQTSNGTCTCKPSYYGSACSSQCNCNGYKCRDGAVGDGKCTCPFTYTLSGPRCSFPTMGCLVAFVLLISIVGLFYYCRRWKKDNAKVHDLKLENNLIEHDYSLLEENYNVLEETYNVLGIQHNETKQQLNDFTNFEDHWKKIAGTKFDDVTLMSKQIAETLAKKHGNDRAYCFVNPGNIRRVYESKSFKSLSRNKNTMHTASENSNNPWRLMELEQHNCFKFGSPLNHLLDKNPIISYCPPEMARIIVQRSKGKPDEGETKSVLETKDTHDTIQATFDVWSFGAILYQLVTGEPLFAATNAQYKISENDLDRLSNWQEPQNDAMFEAKLENIFSKEDKTLREDARDLIRWCLQGDPRLRPQSMKDVLGHCLLTNDRSKGQRWIKERKGFFLSHYQTNAGPSVMQLKNAILNVVGDKAQTVTSVDVEAEKFSTNDFHIWLDKDENPNEQGMKAGVAKCECFLLVLSDQVFSRWFCQLEIKEALRLGKKIVLVDLVKAKTATGVKVAADSFNDYIVQCLKFFTKEQQNIIFASNSIQFHDDDDFDRISARQILKEAGYLATHQDGKIKDETKRLGQLSITDTDILVVGVGGYLRPLITQMAKALPSVVFRATADMTGDKNKGAAAALRSAQNIIFFITKTSFTDAVTVNVLSKCADKHVILVRETDTRQGSMADAEIRQKAKEKLEQSTFSNIFGTCTDDHDSKYIIPFCTVEDFRNESVKKILFALR